MAIYNWKYDRNSRVIKVSTVRWLQMWPKNLHQWSEIKEVRKTHYHKIDTPSITTISLIHFQHKLNKEKWSGGKGEHLKKNGVNVKICLSPFCNENMSVELKIESSIKQMMRYWARDRCTMQKQDDHDRWTYPEASSKCQPGERMCRAKKWERNP